MINLSQSRLIRKILPGLALCTILLQASGEIRYVHAQTADAVKLTARVGFDGYCKQDTWLPIRVEVENSGSDLDATVEVSYKDTLEGDSTTSMGVALPATSRKEFFLYAYPKGLIRQLNVSLVERNRILKRINIPINCLSSENMLFGLLTDNPSAFDILNEVKPLSGFVRVAQLNISDLPERAQAWDSLSALIISNVDTGIFTPGQKQALETWLGTGGKLFVAGGLKWQGTVAGLQEVLPIDVNSTRNVSGLSTLEAYSQDSGPLETGAVLAVGGIREGANVVVEQDGVPVIVQRQVGFGTVTYLAADPALQPLSGWDGMGDLYTFLIGFKSPLPRWADQFSDVYSANRALGAITELGVPSIVYICSLLVIYVVVVGPLNYFVLRRMKRRELAWGTIPALVILFTVVAYGSGYLYRGATPILNRLIIAQAWDGLDQAQARALIGIYSPVRAKYDLEAESPFMLQPFGGTGGNLQPNDHWAVVQAGSNMVVPDVSVEIGGMKAVTAEGTLPALAVDHNLTLSIGKASPRLSGRITNKSEYTLQGVTLVTPSDWKILGDIAPGESTTVNISLLINSTGPNFYSSGSYIGMPNLNYQDLQTNVEAARRTAFLETVLTSTDYRINDGNWGIYLIGWVDQPVLPIGLKDRKFDTVDTMLYIAMLSPTVKTERGSLTLPVSLFTWESSTPNASPYYAGSIPTGGYVLRFKPAFPIHFNAIRSLTFSLQSNALPGELFTSIWDHERKVWDSFVATGWQTKIPEADRYVGPDGEIRIKIVNNRSAWTEITASYVTLVIEP